MRLPQHSSRGTLGFNMTPMIDIVFLLIIFFLVSSHLAQQELQLELDLPTAASGRATETQPDARRIVVNILPEPRDDRRILVGGQLLDVPELGRLIGYEQKQQNEKNRRQGTDQPLEVRIRCDRHVPYREVEPVMCTCARSGVWNVTFAVFQGKE